MNVVFLIGRIILGGYFIHGAINHFTHVGSMSGYAKSKGAPAPEAAVVGSGILLLLGGLSVLLGVYPFVGCILLLIFLAGVSPVMHAFWSVDDPMARMAEQINFTKNLALLGAILIILTIPAPWPYRW
ncbi:MAG: DoxX family membrane protein [Acidobacteriota bacterium]|nr:DoxX family membrane protein [Acidobacteriota bacterium]